MSLLRTAARHDAGWSRQGDHRPHRRLRRLLGASQLGSRHNGTTMMLVGGITFVAATVYDIVDSGGAVRRRNNRAMMVAPMYAQTQSGAVPGVALAGRF
jgi:hypothetical protein